MEQPRPFVFCLVPPDLADELMEPLRAHFADTPMLDVIVERRGRENSDSIEDRHRRLIAKQHAEQRAPVVPREQLVSELPPELAEYADRLQFVQRLAPVRPGLERRDILQVVELMQAGDANAPSELYWRSFERIHRRLTMQLNPEQADAQVKATFGRIFDRLPEFDPREDQLLTWLDGVVDDHVAQLAVRNQAKAEPPRPLAAQRERTSTRKPSGSRKNAA